MSTALAERGALDPDHLLALLDFHVAAGVDCALDDAPHDRFAEALDPRSAPDAAPKADTASRADTASKAMPAPRAMQAPRAEPEGLARPAPSARPLPRAATLAPDAVAADARQRARAATTLEDLRAIATAFDGCALKASATQIAFADGTPGARVMLVGEAPGAEEDRTGRPFVGKAGQLLDRMLAAIGLDRTSVYVANVVPWRPPGNRTPTPQEVAICRPFIERQIELAAPDFLVTIGAPATRSLLGLKEGMFRMRGRWTPYGAGGRTIRALPMLHPAYLLRQPLHKRHAWRDLRALRRALDGDGSHNAEVGTETPAAD